MEAPYATLLAVRKERPLAPARLHMCTSSRARLKAMTTFGVAPLKTHHFDASICSRRQDNERV